MTMFYLGWQTRDTSPIIAWIVMFVSFLFASVIGLVLWEKITGYDLPYYFREQ